MPQQRKPFRVFVVDDEHIIASTLATILQRNGFDAIAYTDPMQALAAARTSAPDLLISDVVMPTLSGIDLAILLRHEHPEIRILLFSGQAATANLLEAAKIKGYDFDLLSKPIHPADFLLKIKVVTEGVAS